jgi:ureidoglycolate hydrolase
MTNTYSLQWLQADLITPESFQRYGQLISASDDGKVFDQQDAQLQIQNGIPRFYIMRLHDRGRKFHHITRHHQCTQCLGSLEGKEWLMAVAIGVNDRPDLESLKAFRISGNCFIKLNVNTWHAGPYFDADAVDFYNLELSDTNITDHETCDLLETYNIEYQIV